MCVWQYVSGWARGSSTGKYPGQARQWWEKAAGAGLIEAMTKLGILLRDSDPGQARQWLDKAARTGDTVAMYSLGVVLREMFTGQTELVEGAWGASASRWGVVLELRGLVRWLLKEDRAGRPAGAGVVAERLRALERKLPPALLALKLVPAPVPAL